MTALQEFSDSDLSPMIAKIKEIDGEIEEHKDFLDYNTFTHSK